MNPTNAILALLAGLGLAASVQAQTTILNDTFDIGSPATVGNDVADPEDIAWNKRNAAGFSFSYSVSADTGGALAGTGNSLDLNITGSGSPVADFWGRFPETTLAVNDVLTFSFSIRLYSPSPDALGLFRISFANSTAVGSAWDNSDSGSAYAFLLGTGSPTGSANQLSFRSTSSIPSGGSPVVNLGGQTSLTISDTLSHTVTFSVTRVSETENLVSFKLDDGTPVSVTTTQGITAVAGGAVLTAFDHVGIMVTSAPFRYRLDNLKVQKTTLIGGDTDTDGLDDIWENVNFGNLTQTGTGDPDNDTFSNEEEETAGSNPNLAASTPLDLDADGLADAWEVIHFGNTTAQNGSGDPDRDLVNNAQELAANTNPADAASWPDTDTDTLNDAWEILYFGSISASDAIPSANPDGDAFTNKQENDAFSNPNIAISVPGDFDGDGLADTWEIANFGNITSHTGIGDADSDRATNEQEETAGTNPSSNISWPDADGDFINDAWEVFYFGSIALHDTFSDPDGDGYNNDIEHTFGFDPTDPLSSPDDDGDGVADGWEIAFYGSTATHDGDSDPDTDGFSNRYESAFRTDPTNANSQPGDVDGDGVSDGIVLRPGGDAQPNTSFISSGTSVPGWIDGAFPSAGKTYIVDRGSTLRSPHQTGTAYTFAGDRLVIKSRATLLWKHNGSLTVPLLQSSGGSLTQAIGADTTVGTLNGNLELLGTNVSTISASNGAFVVNAPISGTGSLNIAGNYLVTLNGALTLTGNITVPAAYPNPATNRLTLGAASSLSFNLGNGGVTNTISGAGVITLNGDISINRSAVTSATIGNTWNLLTNTGGRTYGATFSVVGYVSDSGTTGARKWTSAFAPFYEFDEATGALAIVNATDTDSDGLYDVYEQSVFGNLAQTPSSDADGDLVTNLEEFNAGTNPVDPNSFPDTDADGVADAWELLTFGNLTTATATDKDGDTLLDVWEIFHFTNITAQSGSGNPDADAFTNAQEFAASSIPTNAASIPTDTDGNGVLDVNEQVAPYAVDADTLHLWSFNELVPPFANAASSSHPLRGLLNGATNLTPSVGGFGTSVKTNTGVSPNFGIVTYAATLTNSTTGDTASPASPVFNWKGVDGAFTLEAMVKLDSLPTTWTGTSSTTANIISMDGEGDATQDRVFQFRISNTGSLQFVRINGTTSTSPAVTLAASLPLTGNHALDTTNWFHVAVTYDGNENTAGNLKFYWTKVAPGVTAANLIGAENLAVDFPAVVHGDLSIGNEARDTGGTTEYFRGSIDEVRISSIARADSGFLFKSTSTFAAPTSLNATPGVNSVALSWNASVGASTYTIKRSTVTGGPYTTLSSGVVTGTTYTDNTVVSGTTYFYVVSAVGAVESPDSAQVSVTASQGSAFQSWALTNGLTSGVNDGPTQDPDNDGLANLLEYATGATNNPLAATANPLTTSIITNGSSQKVLRLSFPRVNDPALSYVVQASDTLTGGFTDVQTYPADATPVQHDDTVPLTSGVRRFLRLEVRQN
jgi:hypothetical protein